MNDNQSEEGKSVITLEEIFYVLFRHKKKIIFIFLLSLIAAAAFWKLKAPPWQSEAKLLIRYVTETKSPTTAGTEANKTVDDRSENVINTEIQILTSFDLAQQVARNLGTATLLKKDGGSNALEKAALLIQNNLIVDAPQKGSVIQITFKNSDRTLVQPVLNAVVDVYFKTHLEIHRAGGVLGGYLTKETDDLYKQITQLEEELRVAHNKTGVLSIEDASKTAEEELARIRQEIFEAEADMAEHQAIVERLTKPAQTASATTNEIRPIPAAPSQSETLAYRNVTTRLKVLYNKESELLSQFTEETSMVKDIRRQIAEAEEVKKQIEDKNPEFYSSATMATFASLRSGDQREATDNLATESARVASLTSRIKVLKTQLSQIRDQVSSLLAMQPTIQDLQRKKEQADSRYKNLSASLEQYHLDDNLGAGKGLNISKIQAPSPPFREMTKRMKATLMIIFCGFLGGIGCAFGIDRFLDLSVKRPKDFQQKLGLPLFLSIPALPAPPRRQIAEFALANEVSDERALVTVSSQPSSKEHQERMRLYCEALGSRIVANLQARGVAHKPKLLAVTGVGRGAGVTTIAVGLAAVLSEAGDGNVLLVDMNAGQEAAQHFYKGKPCCGLEAALEMESRSDALVKDNLYVAIGNQNNDTPPGLLPKQFSKMLPQLRASDYDYIVFDMPPVSQTSITSRVAGLMDLVVFTVAAEKTGLEVVQQANALLEQSRAKVGFVLNQTPSYVPAILSQDTLNEI